jgi:hypothetical protein
VTLYTKQVIAFEIGRYYAPFRIKKSPVRSGKGSAPGADRVRRRT